MTKGHRGLHLIAFAGLAAAAPAAPAPLAAEQVVDAKAILAALPPMFAGMPLLQTYSTSKVYKRKATDLTPIITIYAEKIQSYFPSLNESAEAVTDDLPMKQWNNLKSARSSKFPNGQGWYIEYSKSDNGYCGAFGQQWEMDIADVRVSISTCAASKKQLSVQRSEIEKQVFGKVSLSPWVQMAVAEDEQ